MASFSYALIFLSLLPLLFPFISSSTTFPLSFFTTNASQDLYNKLTHLASISLARAKYIKKSQGSSISATPLYPHSYGGYSITLGFGTPPQKLPFIMDTGSDFVWFPCTKKYLCKNCSVSSSGSQQSIPTFIPKSSSTSRVVGCMNPKCGWIHSKTSTKSRCQDCHWPSRTNCKQICPPYIILYGSGSTGGLALVETLDMSNTKKFSNFLVGCSMFSSQQPAGIVGFGRGLASLPSQLGVKKFCYCLVSHKFDDTSRSSNLVLDFKGSEKSTNLSYTPLLKNPMVRGENALSVYYYVGLKKITVGGKKAKIPYKYVTPDIKGNGGTIVDSGTTFTYMNRGVFEPVFNAFVKQVKGIPRTENLEKSTGLRPCYNISSHKTVSLPELKLHFKGGSVMALPLANYFSIAGESDAICLTMITDDFGQELSTGPSIILGNFQMQNFFVEFDLENEKFGFRHQMCK